MSPKYLQNIWTNPYLNKKHKDRQPLPETLLWFCRNCFPEDKWQYLRFCDFPVHLPKWKNLRSAHLENYRNLQIFPSIPFHQIWRMWLSPAAPYLRLNIRVCCRHPDTRLPCLVSDWNFEKS